MHPNPVFRNEEAARNIAFVREQSFGVLAVNAPDGPLLSHIPFTLSQDGASLEAHLVRSNPILRLLDTPQPAVLAVSGPHGYVSPDWYGINDQVPTWNYVAVHLRGALKRLPDDTLHPVLERLSVNFETRLAPKTPWTISKMDQEAYQRMLRQIVPVAMEVECIDSTWKLSQNKTDEVRLAAAEGMGRSGIGMETPDLAILMKSAGSGRR